MNQFSINGGVAAFFLRHFGNQNGCSRATLWKLKNSMHYLLPREQFQQMLFAETKRADRSGNSMLLIVIKCTKDCGELEAFRLLTRASEALRPVIRETDIAGWFEPNRTLGVIFTEFGDSSPSLATKIIENKVTGSLRKVFAGHHLSKIHISLFPHPHRWPGEGVSRVQAQVVDLPAVDNELCIDGFTRTASTSVVNKLG